MTYGTELRVALAAAQGSDDETRETIAAWTDRARRLAAFVKERCDPDLPPITVYVSPIESARTDEPLPP